MTYDEWKLASPYDDEPEPCKCGGDVNLHTDIPITKYWVLCDGCQAYKGTWRTERLAIAAWNTRTLTTPQQGQDAPETIWALAYDMEHQDEGDWSSDPDPLFGKAGVQYTRTDLSDARIAELEQMNRDLQAQKLRLIETMPDPEAALATARNDSELWEAAARFLWDRLDDIDTLDDSCRSNDLSFRNLAREKQKRRYEISTSDGYVVTFNFDNIRALKDTQGEG